MFITKKSRLKILLIGIAYIIVASFCVVSSVYLASLGEENKLWCLGVALYILCPLIVLCGIYAEGKGKLVNLGNKLVRNDLNPREFIAHYENLKSSPDLVVNKPSLEVLLMVLAAYEALDDKERIFATLDEMLLIAKDKKKSFVKLLKASCLFDNGKIDEAEALFSEVSSSKTDFLCVALSDSILKTDRAKAIGDYKTAEVNLLKRLEQKFPKRDNLSNLVLYFNLAEIYEKTADIEKAVSYYEYCVQNGGETAIKASAKEALERLK